MKPSVYPNRSEFLESFYDIAIAIHTRLAGTLLIHKLSKSRNGSYSGFNGHSPSALFSNTDVLSTSQAAQAAGCRLCLIACNSRHGDEVGGWR
jgi:hypothetical protein